ncbi:MAG: HAD-IB family hydrolase [Calditrichaceae bacterium]|nr:HAD-IB family hydrolase [Calditrichaceae bacterium]MBN2707776.1 HAD-IB family hydrolase [Calditrichaceae bacterium]RQV96410.1 MAG: HAD-IB family hydrolase [Calditrichota bacterium]
MAQYAAFFDLDDTVFSINSGKLMARYAAQNGLLKKKHIVQTYLLGLGFILNILSEKFVMERIAGFLKGLDESKIIRFSEEIFDKFIKDSIREKAVSEIERHRKSGGTTVILSASTPYICSQVKRYLNMDDMICSELEVIDGKLSGSPIAEYCYDQEKARRIRAYCLEHGFNPKEAWYYGDAVSDRPALETVGHPVCVSPGRKMARLAKKNNWEIVYW